MYIIETRIRVNARNIALNDILYCFLELCCHLQNPPIMAVQILTKANHPFEILSVIIQNQFLKPGFSNNYLNMGTPKDKRQTGAMGLNDVNPNINVM